MTANPHRVEITRRVVGFGPPIVLVHGVAADGGTFRLLEQLLADRFTVVTVDRRGRCGSGDCDPYSLEAEFDDLVGVVEALSEPVIVFGHSFGANIALGAALRCSRIEKLVLYEPGHQGVAPPGLREELERLIERDEREEAMRLTLLRVHSFSRGMARRPARDAALASTAGVRTHDPA